MSMKLAFSRPTTTTEDRDSLFRSYRSIGYEGLQMKYGQYAPYITEPERFLEEWGAYPGIGSALITGGTLDEDSNAALRKLLRFGQQIGTEIIVYCHGIPRNQVTAQDIRKYAAVMTELGKEARQYGISLSLHHHHDQPVMYREDFDIFFNEVRDQAVGLTVDTAHLVKSGIHDVAELVTSFAAVIDNFHMKDYADGEWRVLGQGNIDFKPIFEAIRQTGYAGWVSADEESGGDIILGMQDCYAFMQMGLAISK
jgi:inosose dehydratase